MSEYLYWARHRLFGANGFWGWLSEHAPRKLVYFCAIRLGSHATTGRYGSTVVPELTFMDALKRWDYDPYHFDEKAPA